MTNYAVKSGSRESVQNTRDAIRNREPFKTSGSLYGLSWSNGLGRLKHYWHAAFYADIENGGIDYVVYSYGTPIAWWSPVTGWTVPNVRYSSTTSIHQGVVRQALRIEDTEYREELS